MQVLLLAYIMIVKSSIGLVSHSPREVALCGLKLGLSLDIGQYVETGTAKSLKVVIRRSGVRPGCRVILDTAHCPVDKCRQELCPVHTLEEEEVIRFALVEDKDKEGKGMKWGVECEIFTREEVGEADPTSRSGDDSDRDDIRGNIDEEEIIEEMLPTVYKRGNEECKNLFSQNQTQYAASSCCDGGEGDPGCLLGEYLSIAKKRKVSSESTLTPLHHDKDHKNESSFNKHTTNVIRSTTTTLSPEASGVEKKKIVSSLRSSYNTLLAFFLIFLVIFLIIIGILFYKLRQAKGKSATLADNVLATKHQETSHYRYSECMPLTPANSLERQALPQGSAFPFTEGEDSPEIRNAPERTNPFNNSRN